MSPRVGILVGSESDLPVLEKCTARLEGYGIEYELEVRSAHRNPEGVSEYAGTARERGLKVIICAAGMAAHLASRRSTHEPARYRDTRCLRHFRWLRRPARHSPDALGRPCRHGGRQRRRQRRRASGPDPRALDPNSPRGWTADGAIRYPPLDRGTIPSRYLTGVLPSG